MYIEMLKNNMIICIGRETTIISAIENFSFYPSYITICIKLSIMQT